MKVQNLILALLTAGLFTCCAKDSGNPISKTYDLADFTALDVSHAFEVEVLPSDVESVEVVISSGIEKYLLVEKKGATLRIGMKRGYTGWLRVNPCMKAYVSCKALTSIEASGASDVELKAAYDAMGQNMEIDLSGASSFKGQLLNVNRLTADLSGASSIKGQVLNANRLEVELSGASEMGMDGNGNEMDLEASGASKADLADFPVKNFEGELSGASKGILYVTESFKVKASGASEVEVKGHPTVVKIDESGSSTVEFK
ncbi:MAG: DUF2807 domain-containing protein [Bacteroidales bacterium]|nr:DUF2807 domain-containing protein [Bacteroidales bacterium]